MKELKTILLAIIFGAIAGALATFILLKDLKK